MATVPNYTPTIEELRLPPQEQFTLYNGRNYRVWKENYDRSCRLTGKDEIWAVEYVDAYMKSEFHHRLKGLPHRIPPAGGENGDEKVERLRLFWMEFEKQFYKQKKTVSDLKKVVVNTDETGGSFMERFNNVLRDIPTDHLTGKEIQNLLLLERATVTCE
jgi:hypothetical protein